MLWATEFICKFGWMFLPKYKFDSCKNTWVWKGKEDQTRVGLDSIDYSSGQMVTKLSYETENPTPFEVVDPSKIKSFEEYKEEAKIHLIQTVKSYKDE